MTTAGTTLSIHLLGRCRIEARGMDVTGKIRRKSLALLKALADSHPRGLSREALADLLWPNSESAASFLSLKVEAHNLRRSLGCSARDENAWISTDRGVYRLADSVWIDFHAFEAQLKNGKRAETAKNIEAAEEAYKRALELYQGDYLEDDLYEEWALITRERLRDQHLYILGKLATFAAMKRNYTEAIDFAHLIIQSDPCREDIYQILMLAHGSLGQISRSSAWYSVARQAMRRELDRDVSSKTTAIFESLNKKANNSVLTNTA